MKKLDDKRLSRLRARAAEVILNLSVQSAEIYFSGACILSRLGDTFHRMKIINVVPKELREILRPYVQDKYVEEARVSDAACENNGQVYKVMGYRADLSRENELRKLIDKRIRLSTGRAKPIAVREIDPCPPRSD